MKRLGDGELIQILDKIDSRNDQVSFYQVSKQFLRAACFYLRKLDSSFPDLVKDVLSAAPNIIDFEMSKPLSNAHMKLLAKSCPKLRYLYLHLEEKYDSQRADYEPGECDFDDDGLCAVANACNDLDIVTLEGRLHFRDAGLFALVRSCKNLRSLDLKRCVNVTDETLKVIGEAECLYHLDVQGCHLISDLGLKHLANGKLKYSMEVLNLSECNRISDDGIIYLRQMPSLSILDLSKCGVNVTDSGVVAIAQSPSIKGLKLSWLINVTDISMFCIASMCLKLTAIHLNGSEAITPKGLHAFAHHKKLVEIELFACHTISWKDVEAVANTCKKLRYLGLSRKIKTPSPEASFVYSFFGGQQCMIEWR
ncbi:leucine-rich repeat, cysteine-containing subtype protein [Tanacetum coccineum]